MADIVAYAELVERRGAEERLTFVRLILAMDAAFLEHVSEQQKKKRRT